MAERYEVVIDFSGLQAGETVTLLNTAAGGDMGQVMQFVGNGVTVPSKPVPASLNDYDFAKEEKRRRQRRHPAVLPVRPQERPVVDQRPALGRPDRRRPAGRDQ